MPGYSDKINHPAFKKYIKSRKQYALIFSIGLAIIAIIGFYIYGETSYEMDNPEALYIGLGIGGMFLLIGLYSVLQINKSKTWDGRVKDKAIRHKRRKIYNTGDKNDFYWQSYIEYTVFIQSDSGKLITEITSEDDDTLYRYYNIGERVRHHGGLNSYEKYDKSKDDIIFCNACASLNDINEDYCHRCHCPLLK
ncbi:MAG: hypothetical protein JXQ26_04780 [Tissierellales bacterium]|nr:hypothetical protein [Tissierellales bacterium]MBN2827278.1 hypothetical protein [Tissierellales bacterium]